MREEPEHFKSNVPKIIELRKKRITPFYFDQESWDLPATPKYWLHDVALFFQNLLAGNDMQATRTFLTGQSTDYIEDFSYYDGMTVDTVVGVVTNFHKYKSFENAMQNLNSTSCMNLINCLKIIMKVSAKFNNVDD